VAPPLAEPAGPEAIYRAKLAGEGGPAVSNVAYLARLPEAEGRRFAGAVVRKPTRSLSGVAVVAVMTAPAHCPHGRCTYCPGGLEQRSPQSYTGEEPSALRGAQFRYDAEAIVRHRLATLEEIGHPTSKVEVIVMGGTFPARPLTYQRTVLKGVYDGLNGTRSATLEEAVGRNEAAVHRLVGLTVETRPDWCGPAVLAPLLAAGVTRVELGVECLDDAVLERVHRAHPLDDVATASRTARDHGLKVGYHMMLGLPGMDPERDFAGFRVLWAEAKYRPDFLKIYPTLVLPGTELYDEWRAGRYVPYDTETAAELLARIKAEVPPWVRIHRIQRDIPARLIAAGVRTSNVRQLALQRLRARGGRCHCLRCREPGRGASPPADEFQPQRIDYAAAGGRETFLSFEHAATDRCAAYLRLRFPSPDEADGRGDPIVRELKVLGRELAVGEVASTSETYQHRGFGGALLARAEALASEAGWAQLYVTAAVGTRPYYAARGYAREGPYVVKALRAGGRAGTLRDGPSLA
jgi:elongator complex protein 3